VRIRARRMPVVSVAVFLICLVPSSYGQNATMSGMVPRYVRKAPVDVNAVEPFTVDTVLAVKPTPISNSAETSSLPGFLAGDASTTTGSGGNISGLATVPTFAGAFAPGAGPSLGTVFPFIMMGNDPLLGGTTTIPAKITEISLKLLNANGTTFKTVSFTSFFDDAMTDSPNFVNAVYDSSLVPTQFADAVQRAEFFHTGKSSWHTLLGGPTIVNHVTITIPKTVNVTLANGNTITATAYFTGTAADGSTFVLMLDILFNSLFGNQVVNDISSGHFTTSALNIEMFPNTFLFSLNQSQPNSPGNCCVLGFHTYFLQSGVTPQPRWITIFGSWISPGVFSAGVQDVTGLSHEISESFNDPFLRNATPLWQFPNQPSTSKVCQGNLETGDPVEVLPTSTVSLTLTEAPGTTSAETFTFHPQTEALLQWFEMGATSNAVDGKFSYPNETALSKSAVPCP